MKIFTFFILTLALISSGCTSYKVNAEEIMFAPSSKFATENEVQYLETATAPYEVIGHVTVNTERRNSLEEVAEKMKRQVAMLGGDAVTNIVQSDKPSLITHVRTVYTGTVIIFKNTAAGVSSPRSNPVPAADTQENLK